VVVVNVYVVFLLGMVNAGIRIGVGFVEMVVACRAEGNPMVVVVGGCCCCCCLTPEILDEMAGPSRKDNPCSFADTATQTAT